MSCPRCLGQLTLDVRFCGRCGLELATWPQPVPTTPVVAQVPTPARKGRNGAAIGSLVAGVIVFGLVAWFMGTGSSSGEPGARPTPTPRVGVAATAAPQEADPTAEPDSADLSELSFPSLKALAKKPTYKALLRSSEDFEGELVYLRGEVLQAQEDEDGEGQFLLVSVTKGRYGIWKDNVALVYPSRPRVIPDDLVELVMTGGGTYGYESAGAGYLTVPAGVVVKLRVLS